VDEFKQQFLLLGVAIAKVPVAITNKQQKLFKVLQKLLRLI
jgi:hypothetical protein